MSRRNSPVPDWIPSDLPAAPGVYQFQDAVGTPIYVGKSVNVRRRVRGYFYAGGPKDERMALMVRLARGIEVHPAGTDLEAKLAVLGIELEEALVLLEGLLLRALLDVLPRRIQNFPLIDGQSALRPPAS